MADQDEAKKNQEAEGRADRRAMQGWIERTFSDPEFRKLDGIHKIQVMEQADPEFAAIPTMADKSRVVQSYLYQIPTAMPSTGSALKDFAESFASEAFAPVIYGGDLLRRMTGTGQKNRPLDQPEVQYFLKPYESTAGKAGALAEPIIETFVAPELKAKQVPKLLKSGAALMRAGKPVLRETLPSLTRRTAFEAAKMGTQAELHGDQPIPGAVLGASGPIAGRLLQAAAPTVERYAGWLYRRALDPTKTVPKIQTGEVVPELLQRRFWAATWPRLKSAAQQNLEQAGKDLEQVEDQTVQKFQQTYTMTGAGRSPYGPVINMQKGAFSVRPVLDELQNMMGKTMVRGRFPTQQSRIEYSLLRDQYRRLAQYGNTVTLREAIDIRRLLDKPLGQKGAFQISPKWATLEQVQLATANKLRGLINDQFPELAAANHEYHLWKSVTNIMQETDQRKIGQAGGLAQVLASGGAMLHGLLTGKDLVRGIRDVMVANAAFAAARSPGFKTMRAVQWQKFADTLDSRDLEGFFRAASTLVRPSKDQGDDFDVPPLIGPGARPPATNAAPTPRAQAAPAPAAASPTAGATAGAAGKPEVGQMLADASRKYQVPLGLLRAMAQSESGTDQSQVSPKGAIGVMQLMPDTAKGLGVDPTDVRQNIDAGARYMAQMLKLYPGERNLALALAAYNAGPGAVQQYSGVPPYQETQEYIRRVLGQYKPSPMR